MSVEESVLADLEKKLENNLFVKGAQPSHDDAEAFAKFVEAKVVPDQDKYPSVWAWYSLMVLFEDEVIKSWKPQQGKQEQHKKEKGGKGGKKNKNEEKKEEKAEEDDLDLFGDETEEDKKAKEEMKQKNKEKKGKKKKKLINLMSF